MQVNLRSENGEAHVCVRWLCIYRRPTAIQKTQPTVSNYWVKKTLEK